LGDDLADPILGDRFADAARYAVELHATQARKSTWIPYVTHLFAVCSLVLEDGGTEDEAIAALLHDGPEDQGGQAVLDEIERRFGGEVARVVDALSDTLLDPKPPWRPRKEAYLARLRREPESVLRISLADKLHNARSILVDHLAAADAPVWARFSAGHEEQAWYFRELLAVFEERLPESRNLPEFRRVVGELFGTAGSGFQTA
jgi:(p)ppGpp synthase/HD superfamily hydrolase